MKGNSPSILFAILQKKSLLMISLGLFILEGYKSEGPCFAKY
jgi:hypothetical protein